ncbi:hypothetical protein AVEN_125038-1 [Araneus ventricosus]|uniref:Uncharacterized protein n=1 Tax=Araneus ventricosus TaxID=182803 RepID=A0A4Y2GXE6_ARAVE|nr:hypothetical protein AVEN_125038-1 [Araneus ventricosus]
MKFGQQRQNHVCSVSLNANSNAQHLKPSFPILLNEIQCQQRQNCHSRSLSHSSKIRTPSAKPSSESLHSMQIRTPSANTHVIPVTPSVNWTPSAAPSFPIAPAQCNSDDQRQHP